MAFTVKNFNWKLRGAPILNGTPSSFINLLKACLIDGFGEVTAITGKIENGICTIETNQNESFQTDTVVSISGANVTSVNGEQWVLSSSASKFSFKTLESDQTLLGTIKVKYAPVGSWYFPFTGTSTAALLTADSSVEPIYFIIDDTQARFSSLRMARKMTDMDIASDVIPPLNVSAYRILRSINADAVSRMWYLIADSKTIYFSRALTYPENDYNRNNQPFLTCAIGYYKPEGHASKLTAFINAETANSITSGNNYNYIDGPNEYLDVFYSRFSDRKSKVIYYHPGTNTYNENATTMSRLSSFENVSGGSNQLFASIVRPTRKRIISDMLVTSRGHILGTMPGIRYIGSSTPYNRSRYGLVEQGTGDLIGRRLINVPCAAGTSNLWLTSNFDASLTGVGLIDITGPW